MSIKNEPVPRDVYNAHMAERDARIAELTAEVVQVRSEFAEGQGEYEQLDRLMQANERNMQRRIDGLTAEVERYRSALSSVTDFSSDPAVIRIARNALRDG